MMAVLLICYMLIAGTTVFINQAKAVVRFTVLRQQVVKNKDVPFHNRLVTLTLKNESSSTVIVYGVKVGTAFDPGGYTMQYDPRAKKWLYPNSDNHAISWEETPESEKDQYKLLPGEAIKVQMLMGKQGVGTRFKRIVFVSLTEGVAPQPVACMFLLR